MMKRGIKNQSKRGAASFYIVAFSTLILIIIAMSFAAVIISQMARTSNEDLAQSAYDSALAGVEDAKLAYMSYQKCVNAGEVTPNFAVDNRVTCGDIVHWVEEEPDCDSVAHVLGRLGESESGEVAVKESTSAGNNMQQAYTCTKIETSLKDYRSTLNNMNQARVVRVSLDDVDASNIKRAKVSWYSDINGAIQTYPNFVSSSGGGKISFPSLVKKQAATPPMISVGMIQTSGNFNVEDFDMTKNGQTNRATVYLVPTDNEGWARSGRADNYVGVYNGSENIVNRDQMLKTNDKVARNLPYGVYCDANAANEFACSATLELPDAIGGGRSNDTFIFVVSIPYGKPSTDFALEFFCDGPCPTISGTVPEGESSQAKLKGTQISVDSTGRANDLFRRVEMRLEPTDATFPYPLYAIQLLNPAGDKSTLRKNLVVTVENGME